MNKISRTVSGALLAGGMLVTLNACVRSQAASDTTAAATTVAATQPAATQPAATEPAATEPAATETTAAADQTDDSAPVLVSAVDSTLAAGSFSVDAETSLNVGTETVFLQVDGYLGGTLADVQMSIDENGAVSTVNAKSDGTTLWVQDSNFGPLWKQSLLTEANPDGLPTAGLIGPIIMLRAAKGVAVVGTSQMDGVNVTEYTATYPYTDAVAAAGDLEAQFSSALSLTGAATTADLQVDVFIGDDNIIRDLHFEIVNNDYVTGGGSVVLTGVNQPTPTPDPPAADQIAPATTQPAG